MLAVGVAFAILLGIYIYLRSQGGKGLSISFKLPPASSSEGKQKRLALIGVLLLLILAFMLLTFGSGGTTRQKLVGVVIVTGIVIHRLLVIRAKREGGDHPQGQRSGKSKNDWELPK